MGIARDRGGKQRRLFHKWVALGFVVLVLVMMVSGVWLFVVVDLDDAVVPTRIRLFFDEPVLTDVVLGNQTFTEVWMAECVSLAQVGSPALPIFTVNVVVPCGMMVGDVVVSYGAAVVVSYDFVSKPVVPQQELVPFSVPSENVSVVMNVSVYGSSEPVFDDFYSVGLVGWCRGFRVVPIEVHPVQYVPEEGVLYYFPELVISISYVDDVVFGSVVNRFSRGVVEDVSYLSGLVVNPETLGTYAVGRFGDGGVPLEYVGGLCDPGESYRYVIVTNAYLRDASSAVYNWSDLVSHRASFSGLSGCVVTVEEIDACGDYWVNTSVFNDSQAHIREFCRDAYQDWGTEYVVLGGDWHASTSSQQIVPARVFTDEYEYNPYDTMPCDLYYSHLDGDWWYSGGGGMWGGGRSSGVNDLYAELFVGRIAAYTPQMVSNAISKIVWYDLGNHSESWLRSCMFAGSDLGWSVTSKEYMEELRWGNGSFSDNVGFEEWNTLFPDAVLDTSFRYYFDDGNWNSFSPSIEADTCSIINHLGHSSSSTPFSLSSWSGRVNTQPFFGYSQGCLAGRFTDAYAGCEQLLCTSVGSHAFAVVLNTGYGYGSSASTSGASQHQQKIFWDYFFDEAATTPGAWQLGRAQAYSKDGLAAFITIYPRPWCYVWYSAHLFGDPAQCLNLGVENDPVEISSPDPVNGSVNVSVLLGSVSVSLIDPEGGVFDWQISTIPDVGLTLGMNASDGTKTCSLAGLVEDTVYWWSVNVTDGASWSNQSFWFHTEVNHSNTPPVLGDIPNQTIAEGGWFAAIVLDSYVNDSEDADENLSWVITGNSSLLVSVVNRTVNVSSPSSEWFGVETLVFTVTDSGGLSVNDSAVFTVTGVNDPPVVAAIGNQTILEGGVFSTISLDDFVWDPDDADESLVWNVSGCAHISVGIVDRVALISVVDGDWFGSETLMFLVCDDENASDSENVTFTVTNVNDAPVIDQIVPGNSSTGVEQSCSNLSVRLSDADGDLVWFSIETRPDIGLVSGGNVSAGVKVCPISNLSFNTTYWWFVNVTDGLVWENLSLVFTTTEYVSINLDPVVSELSIANETTGVSKTLSSLSVVVVDPEGQSFSWSIETYPDVGSSSGVNASNGTKECVVSGLGYDTVYRWFVNVSDEANWVNESWWFRTKKASSSGGGGGPPPVITEPVDLVSNQAPAVPVFSLVSKRVQVNGSCGVSVEIVDPEGDMVRVQCDWGDNSPLTWSDYRVCNVSFEITYVWVVAGEYFVRMRAEDEVGNSSAWSDAVRVEVFDAHISEVIDSMSVAPQVEKDTVSFVVALENDTLLANYSWEWDFGDGSLGMGVDAKHTYAEPGVYTVRLSIRDTAGLEVETREYTVMVAGTSSGLSEETDVPVVSYSLVVIMFVVGGFLGIFFVVASVIRRKKRKGPGSQSEQDCSDDRSIDFDEFVDK